MKRFGQICIKNAKWIIYKHIFPSIVNLKCTPSDRQMYHQGYMYPSLGTPGLGPCGDVITSDGVSRFGLGLEGFRSRSRALSLETWHELFFYEVLQEATPWKTDLQSYWSKFSSSKLTAAFELSLFLCCYGENNLPSTLFKIVLNSIKTVCASETSAQNFCNACNKTLGVLC